MPFRHACRCGLRTHDRKDDFVAGLFEVGRSVGLEYTDGFTKLWPSLWTVLAVAIMPGAARRDAQVIATRHGLHRVGGYWLCELPIDVGERASICRDGQLEPKTEVA